MSKDYINQLESSIRKYNYIKRFRRKEKEKFRVFLAEELNGSGYKVREDVSKKRLFKNVNVLTDNIEDAEYIFTAHYDTPGTGGIIFRANYFLQKFIGTNLASILILLLLCSLILVVDKAAYIVKVIFLVFLLLELIMLFFIPNKTNMIDNTSGVVGALALAKRFNGNDKVAFIFFDNEEKGLLGSKALSKRMYKDYPDFKNRLVINLDCISSSFEESLWNINSKINTDKYNNLLEAISQKLVKDRTLLNKVTIRSDQLSFKKNSTIAIGKYKKAKLNGFLGLGYYIPNIHSSRDTTMNTEDISKVVEVLYQAL